MADSDLIALYSGRLLELAAAIPLTGRLDAPQGRAKRRSPVCGSSISVDVRLGDGKITDFAQEVRACALGQASASLLGRVVMGCTPDQLRRARDQLTAMLKENGPVPDAPFEDFAALLPARDFANRHGSILLALEAVCAAIDEAAETP